MAYRADLDTRRAEVRGLERELAELRREIALLQGLPSGRDPSARLLGAPRSIAHERTAEVALDRLRDERVASALSRAIGVTGRIERADGGAIVWRADPEPRGRAVEVRIERDVGDRVRVRVVDTHSTLRAVLLSSAGMLPILAQVAFNRSWWFLAIAVPLLVSLPILHALANRRVGRRRERQAIAALDALEALASEEAAAVRARVADLDEAGVTTEESDPSRAGARARSA